MSTLTEDVTGQPEPVSFFEAFSYWLKPAVTAIVVFAACRIGSRALKNNVLHAMAMT